ncbi:MAG: hypothetical protein J5825_03680 [Lachnospiraceae bacterium]|nr:hypothetical protein [Lachnospiraceae bacterium]
MFSKHDIQRNEMMLDGPFARKGYDWWWHSFTGIDAKNGKEKQFFIEYFICNPALGEKDPVFGQLPENQKKGRKPSYLMVKAGCWGENSVQLHRFFGIKQTEIHAEAPFRIAAADCYVGESRLEGSITVTPEQAARHPEWMCDAGTMEWKLKVRKVIPFNVGYGASKPLQKLKAFEMYWHAEGMKSTYEGTVICNGRTYHVIPERSYGYADKNWGSNFTSPWVWLSSCNMTSLLTGRKLNDSVFDIGGGKPKIYCFPLERKLLSAFYYEGKHYEYNFSKFWTGTKTRFTVRETPEAVYWHVRQENKTSVMDTRVRCLKKDMIFVNYESPDGKKLHNRLWNGGNGVGRIRLYKKRPGGMELIDDIRAENVGCEYGEYDA